MAARTSVEAASTTAMRLGHQTHTQAAGAAGRSSRPPLIARTHVPTHRVLGAELGDERLDRARSAAGEVRRERLVALDELGVRVARGEALLARVDQLQHAHAAQLLHARRALQQHRLEQRVGLDAAHEAWLRRVEHARELLERIA